MEVAEAETHARFMRLRAEVVEPTVAAHAGRIVKHLGDGFLASFEDARSAVAAALEVQSAVAQATTDQPAAQRLAFRMGVHLAEVIEAPDDIFGDGVNVAARLQGFAEPGRVMISAAAMEGLDGTQLSTPPLDLGPLSLRNHVAPVRAFSLGATPAKAPALGLAEAGPGDEQRPSVAVLPFRTVPNDPSQAYFAEGLVDDIIHSLSAMKELVVIQRGSTLRYARRGGVDPVAVGRRLRARYVLHGTVQRDSARVRLQTELTDTETGLVLDSDRCEGAPDDLFELQDRISLNLVKTILPQVRERELRRALRKPPQSMTAYDLLLQALDLLYRMDDDSFARARGLLQQAIAQDPGYAAPHTWAALWHVLRVGEMGAPDPAAEGEAAAMHAAAAVERNPRDPMALAIHGHVHSFLLKDYATARHILDRAVEAGPSVAMAWTMSSATYGYLGMGPEAVAHAERGLRLSPADAYTFWYEGILANAHYVAGDYGKAVAWARSAVAQNPRIRFTQRTLVASLAAAGQTEEARAAADRLLRLQPGFSLDRYARACPFVPEVLEGWIGRLRAAGLPA